MTDVGLLYDAVSNNTGDNAIGLVLQRALTKAGVPHRKLNPFDPQLDDLATLIVGGGAIIRQPGHYFYDAFRVPGQHILNSAGIMDGTQTAYLDDYRLVTARSYHGVSLLGRGKMTPCLTMLYDDYIPKGIKPYPIPRNAIGIHLTTNFHEYIMELVDLLRRVDIGPIVWLPVTHYNNDRQLMQSIADYVPNSTVLPNMHPDTVFRTIGQLSGLITLSLHATLFAYAQGVPFLSMASPDKISIFLTERNQQKRLFLTTKDIENRLHLLTQPPDFIESYQRDRHLCTTTLTEIITHAEQALTEGPTPITLPPINKLAYDSEMAFRPAITEVASRLYKELGEARYKIIPRLEGQEETPPPAEPKQGLLSGVRTLITNTLKKTPESAFPIAEEAYAQHLEKHQPALSKPPRPLPSVAIVPTDELTPPLPQADYIIPLPPDVTLAPGAAKQLLTMPADIIYSDYDHLNANDERIDPLFLPDWSPDTMLSTDLFAGACAIKRELLEQVGPPQGDELAAWHLRLSEHATTITHVPRVLAHHRSAPPPPSPAALRAHLQRRGIPEPHITLRDIAAPHPLPRIEWQPASTDKVAIIIPTKDNATLLEFCLESIRQWTTYPNYEIVLVDTGSTEQATRDLYARMDDVTIVNYEGDFNFSRACNMGAAHTDAPRLLFLNNDIRIIEAGWLTRMAQWLDFPEVGLVAPRLLYATTRIQHAGVILGMGGFAAHVFQHMRYNRWGMFGSDVWYRTLLAATGACVLLPRTTFEAIGGWDEGYRLIFSDIALCLSVHKNGQRVVYTPDPVIIHYESQTHRQRLPRGDFLRAKEEFAHWIENGDPYFNKNLSTAETTPQFVYNPNDGPSTHQQRFIESLPDKDWFLYPDELRENSQA